MYFCPTDKEKGQEYPSPSIGTILGLYTKDLPPFC